MKHQCEAILITGAGKAYNLKPGDRCNQSGDNHQADGHHFCWVHLQAYRNPERAEKLRLAVDA